MLDRHSSYHLRFREIQIISVRQMIVRVSKLLSCKSIHIVATRIHSSSTILLTA